MDRGDLIQVSPNRSGVSEIRVVGRDLTAVSHPQRSAAVVSGEGGDDAVGSRSDGGDDGSVDSAESTRQHRRFELRLDAVVRGFIGEFLFGEPARSGGKAVRPEEREKYREDFRVAVYENRV